jgi:hypothetical protein
MLMRFRLIAGVATTVALVALVADRPQAEEEPRGPKPLVVDVAIDGSTWRMDDGSNPFFPTFTGALARGKTFIVSGRIYRAHTLEEGGSFDSPNNPAGPETPGAIGVWVCRGTLNLDIGQIAAGEAPHVTSTQFFYFSNGSSIVSDGPEGGAVVLRAVVGGTGRYKRVRGDVKETPLGVNTSNLFNLRFAFAIR